MENKKACSHCNEEFSTSEMTAIHNGDLVCSGCLNDNYSSDENTSLIYPNSELVTAYEMNNRESRTEIIVHRDNDNYVTTRNGERWHEDDVLTTSQGHVISEIEYRDTHFTCRDCNEVFNQNDETYIENHGGVCEGCLYDSYSYCENHEQYVEHGNCGCNEEENENGLFDHDYKPNPNFKGKASSKNPYMGIELEVESSNGDRSEQVEFCKRFSHDLYLKHDGSLNHGFEIVTHPMTIQEHKKNEYNLLLDNLRKKGAKSHDTVTCGLHVHLDKRKMTDAHKVRFGGFFALCKPELEIFARRSCKQWSKFKEIKTRNEIRDYAYSDSRYEAVNWTNNHTVEVRIFKGTLKFETFLASVELFHAIYSFTQQRNAYPIETGGGIVWGKFISFVKANRKNYKALIGYLDSKKMQIGAAREKYNESEISLEEMAS